MLWRFDDASKFLDQWLANYGSSGEQYYWAGRLAMQQGDVSKAKEYLRKAMEDPDAKTAWKPFFAEALYEAGSFSSAKEALRGLTDEKGARARAQLVLSLIALSERRPTSAKDHAGRALDYMEKDKSGIRDKSRALIAVALAELALGKNRQAAARQYLADALATDNRNVDAHYQMGLLERSAGRNAAARESFEAALAIYPDHEPSRAALNALR
jgi:Tfp pilus assembly protein PilF